MLTSAATQTFLYDVVRSGALL